MAILTYSGYARDPSTGAGIGGCRVRAYPVNNDGTKNMVSYNETTSASSTGAWTISVDTSDLASESGYYAIEVYNPADGRKRWIEPAIKMQIGHFFGANGEAPIANGSVTAAKIANGAVTDDKVGSRTITDTTAPTVDSNVLTTLLSNLANRIKAINGGNSWRDTPAVSLIRLVDGTVVQQLNADLLDGRHASEFALADHTHEGSGGSGSSGSHTHSGSQIIGPVAEATTASQLKGVDGAKFLYLHNGSTDGGTWPQSGPFRMVFGTSAVTTNSSGVATISFPQAFPSGILWSIAMNGDWDAYTQPIYPQSATRTTITIKIPESASRTVRVNWFAIGY